MKLSLAMPTITSHHYYALPLAIIGSDPSLKPWIYSEFVQWYSFRNLEEQRMHMRLYNNKNELHLYEPLHSTVYMSNLLTDGDRIIDVLKALIANNHYIYDFVDSYYISADPRSHHWMHDILLYGFDDKSAVLHAFAYIGNKLEQFDIPYLEYETIYNSDYQKEHVRYTVLYRKKDAAFYPNIQRIGNHLLDYLGGINTYNRESPLEVQLYRPQFGLDVYNELKYDVQYARDWNVDIDVPDLYCVYDHKRLMLERVVYLDENTDLKCSSDLKNKFSEIVDNARIMIMLVLKLNRKMFSSATDYNNLLQRFDMLRELEKDVYTAYYEYNRSVFENA